MTAAALADDMALFIDSAADRALFLTDRAGLIRSWNHGATLLTGWAASEIVGRDATLLYPMADAERRTPELERAAAIAGTTIRHEGWRVRKDGTEFLADITLVALRGATGDHRGFGQSIHDITGRKADEQAL
ncbi:MAG: PAS domain S-box protein, partial [Sphingomonas sp.]